MITKIVFKNIPWILNLCTIVLFTSCEKPEYPDNVWDPDEKGKPTPVIHSVDPPNSGFSGIEEITITGENFSSDPEEVLVFFDGNLGTIMSTSDTQIVVSAPNISGDSITIKVAVVGAFLFAEYSPYKLEPAVIDYGGFGEFDDVYAIAMDTLENLFVSIYSRTVVIVSPDTPNVYSEYASTSYLKATGMRMGPGGYLYCARKHKKIERIPPDGGPNETFATLGEKAIDLDFDSFDNLYAGGKDSTLYRISPEGDVNVVAQYPDGIEIKSVRVYNDFIYIAGKYTGYDTTVIQEGIWRNQIIDSNSLGPTELVFNWGNFAGNGGPEIMAITFSIDGDMFIGSNRDEAIFVLNPPYGESDPKPFYPDVLEPPINWLCWGNSQFLYVSRGDEVTERIVLRIATRKDGAPYYGRK